MNPRLNSLQQQAIALGADRTVRDVPSHIRFREARERVGLTQDQVARQSGFPHAAIWDIESFDNDLTACYTPRQLQQFCRVLRIQPADLFGGKLTQPSIPPEELVRLIFEELFNRGITLQQFEDIVGWRLGQCMTPPERLLEDMTIDGLKWLCRELRLDWRRAL
jgi:transcriptional regulator with XRE-family HTH domain